jgi:hypothetical protein
MTTFVTLSIRRWRFVRLVKTGAGEGARDH